MGKRGRARTGVLRNCTVCGVEFYLRPSFAKDNHYLRCSRACVAKAGLFAIAGRKRWPCKHHWIIEGQDQVATCQKCGEVKVYGRVGALKERLFGLSWAEFRFTRPGGVE